jgi:deoxycytidine triphosphate deaminase
MSVLSDVDIKKELGKNILIYPFCKDNIRGASYNLTASKLAWDLESKNSIYDKANNLINIEPGRTALIETNEAIWVSSKITGSYHSKVKLVSQGLSHIGTTLDPEYLGASLITVHNYGSEIVTLIAEKDTFVTLVFYYVRTLSSINTQGNNTPGQQLLLNGFKIAPDEKEWLNVLKKNA